VARFKSKVKHKKLLKTKKLGHRTYTTQNNRYACLQMGMALTGIFFCTIGASAGSLSACASETPAIFGFIAIMVSGIC